MEYLDKCFYDAYEGIFNEYLSRVEFQMKREIPEYKEMVEQEEKVLDKYPTLRKIVDDREVDELSVKEVGALISILDLFDKKNEMLKSFMFFKGYKEAYYLFNKLGILTTNNQESDNI